MAAVKLNIPNLIKKNPDLFVILFFSLSLTIISILTQTYEKGTVLYLRWIMGILFIYLLSGYPYTVILYPIGSLSFLERLMLSSGFSMVLTYPAGIINEIHEGRINVFIPHLSGDIVALSGIVLIGSIFAMNSRKKEAAFFKTDFLNYMYVFINNKIEILLVINLLIFFYLSLLNIDKAGIYNDEWNLIKQSYNLVDGNFAARNAYTISFVDHSPLGNFIGHFTMQIIDPLGLHHIENVWIFRISSVFIGFLGILFVYIIGKKLFNEYVGLIASVLVGVSGYHVVMTSIFYPRDNIQMIFMIIALHFFYRSVNGTQKDVITSGLFLGAAMLVKFTAVLLIPVLFLLNLFMTGKILDKKILTIFSVGLIIFSPVILYNLGAYLTTGYTDVPFSKLIGNPKSSLGPDIREYSGKTFDFQNLINVMKILIEQFSLILFSLFIISLLYAMFQIYKRRNQNEISVFFVWASITILFFWVVGAGGFYYLHSITAPFAILSGYFIVKILENCRHNIKTFLISALLFLFIYSAQYAYGLSLDEPRFNGNKYFPDYGSSGLRDFLIENYNVSDTELIVVGDDITHSVIGWSISNIILQKISLKAFDFPELEGIKDMNYKRIELQVKGRITFNNRTLITRLSNFSLKDFVKYNRTIVILPNQTRPSMAADFIVYPTQIDPESFNVYIIKYEYIITNYQPSKIIYDFDGIPTFYIYVF